MNVVIYLGFLRNKKARTSDANSTKIKFKKEKTAAKNLVTLRLSKRIELPAAFRGEHMVSTRLKPFQLFRLITLMQKFYFKRGKKIIPNTCAKTMKINLNSTGILLYSCLSSVDDEDKGSDEICTSYFFLLYISLYNGSPKYNAVEISWVIAGVCWKNRRMFSYMAHYSV